MKTKGILLTILSALLFGVTPVLASFTFDMGSNAQTLTFYRNLMVIPVLLAVMLFRKTSLRITKQQLINILIIGVLGCGVTTLILYASYDYIGISTATTLHFLYPVFVALICRLFYHEKLGRVRLVVLICASAGILLFLERDGAVALPGIILAAVSGLTYAFYMVGIDKRKLKDMDPFKLAFYMAITVSVSMLVYHLFNKEIVFALPPKALLYTFIIAIGTSFIGVALLQVGIKYLSATTAAIFCLFEPIASSLSGVIFLGESLSAAKILGSAVILVAAAILAVTGNKESKITAKRE